MEPLHPSSTPEDPEARDPGPASAVAVLYSPSSTFRGLARKPRFLVPFLLLLLLTTVVGGVVMSKLDPAEQRTQMREALEKRGLAGQELEAQVEKTSEVMGKIGPVFALVGALFIGVMVFVVAAALFGGLKLAGAANFSFRQALAVTTHSNMPLVVASLLSIPVALGKETISSAAARGGGLLASNLSVFATEETAATTRALMASVDVFSLWSLVLMILGGAIVGRVSRGASAVVAIILWILGVLLRVGLASLQG